MPFDLINFDPVSCFSFIWIIHQITIHQIKLRRARRMGRGLGLKLGPSVVEDSSLTSHQIPSSEKGAGGC